MEKLASPVFFILSCCIKNCLSQSFQPKAEEGSSGGEQPASTGLTTLQTVLISVGALTGVVVCSFCTWNWWRRFCRALRGIDEPEPEIAVWNTNNRDPVVFPPINTIYDTNGGNVNLLTTYVPSIVPSAVDASAYAHDWFESEIGNNNFNRANVEYVGEMGRGWFGNVVRAQIRTPTNPFQQRSTAVVKVLREEASNRDQMRFLDEARFYRDEAHENILKLLGYSIERIPYLLIFEYFPLGTLKDYLITKCADTQNFSMLIRMAIDVAMGLEWMEHAGFVHGDLAARNCLVATNAGKVKIGDYGLSPQKFHEEYYWSSNTAIPLRWVPPECLHITMNTIITNKATTMSNVWSFGIVLWEILELGKLPYPELTDEQVLDQVIVGRTYVLERPTTTCIPEAVNENLYKIMLSCWNSEPSTRPKISSVIEVLKTP